MKAKGLAVDEDYPKFFKENFGIYRDMVPPLYDRLEAEDIIKTINDAGGIAICAHPDDGRLEYVDDLIAAGLAGIEVWHPDLSEEEKQQAYKIALEKKLFISGGSDHSGLLGGEYEKYKTPKDCPLWIEPFSVGTTKEYFDEIKNRKLAR